jgi:hypothetical protein
MRSAADEPAKTSWSGSGFRLIPSRFPPVAVYENVVAPGSFDALVAIENLTNPRLQSARRLSSTSLASDSPRLQNWNHAPFAYSNPEGTRFFPPDRPCLELADTRQTALAISVARRQRFLVRTKEPAIGLDMRMLKTPAQGNFVDLRQLNLDMSLHERWKIGAQVPIDADGVLYRPPERPSAICVAVLKGDVLGRSLQTEHYRYVWNGSSITKLYAFENEGKELLADLLSGTEDILAA